MGSTVVILPFKNETEEGELGPLVRTSFYNHFSSKNFYDFEPSVVDGILEVYQKKTPQNWRDLSPSNLGHLFQADWMIFGTVKDYRKIFLGLYCQIALTVEIEMIDSKNGNIVWKQMITKRSHEGGFPFTLIGTIPTAVRCGLHIQRENTIALIEKINRELVSRIPDPPAPSASVIMIDLQVASFLEKDNALKLMERFAGLGMKSRLESIEIEKKQLYRVFLGPFYNSAEAAVIQKRVINEMAIKPILIHRPIKIEK